ncbi:MAG: response regulator [Anaerolineae bacterium]|nr:response regulator [Anaerolineae bacterium]
MSDVKNLRISMASILEYAGYRVESTALNNATALLHDKQFHLLFLDLRTPYHEGMKFLSFVRYRYASMNIVVISSIDNLNFRAKVLRNGAKDYLLKPVDPGEIIQACNALLTMPFQ